MTFHIAERLYYTCTTVFSLMFSHIFKMNLLKLCYSFFSDVFSHSWNVSVINVLLCLSDILSYFSNTFLYLYYYLFLRFPTTFKMFIPINFLVLCHLAFLNYSLYTCTIVFFWWLLTFRKYRSFTNTFLFFWCLLIFLNWL